MTNLKIKPIEQSVCTASTTIEAKEVPSVQNKSHLEVLEVQNKLKIRSSIFYFLMITWGLSIVCSWIIVFLQGFHAWGFQISDSSLKWFFTSTIAQSAVFFGMFAKAVWKK